jgi:hypothetical protein
MENKQLETYFNFDSADLAANRAGNLTQKQRDRLAKAERNTRLVSVVLAAISIILTIIPVIRLLTGLFSIGAIIWAVIAAFCAFIFTRRSVEKIHDDIVRKVIGPARIKAERVSSDSSNEKLDYELRIGDEIFDVESEITEYLQPGDMVAVYYLADPHTKSPQEILSLEWISSGQEK